MKVYFSEQEEYPVLTEEDSGEWGASIVVAAFWKVWLWRMVNWLWNWRHRSINAVFWKKYRDGAAHR